MSSLLRTPPFTSAEDQSKYRWGEALAHSLVETRCAWNYQTTSSGRRRQVLLRVVDADFCLEQRRHEGVLNGRETLD